LRRSWIKTVEQKSVEPEIETGRKEGRERNRKKIIGKNEKRRSSPQLDRMRADREVEHASSTGVERDGASKAQAKGGGYGEKGNRKRGGERRRSRRRRRHDWSVRNGKVRRGWLSLADPMMQRQWKEEWCGIGSADWHPHPHRPSGPDRWTKKRDEASAEAGWRSAPAPVAECSAATAGTIPP
jgi:hypothetical protein